MNTDLTMLTASAVLTALLFLPYAAFMWTHWSVGAVLGNRADTPPFAPWAERARRAQANMLENFPHFAALVIVANMAGFANEQTALGATIFFWARLAHAIIYITGIWQLRALAFLAGLAGEVLSSGRSSKAREFYRPRRRSQNAVLLHHERQASFADHD